MMVSSPTIILICPPYFKTTILPSHFKPKPSISLPYSTLQPWKSRIFKLHITAVSSNGEFHDWGKWVPKKVSFGPDNLLKSIAGATSSPICQFISSPFTFLHAVDPRIKLVWLLVLVFLPARSHIYMRFGIVLSLALLSVWTLPANVWM
ncbi:Protein ABCI12 chloroplastic, partial [Bienertia sinuspersici]